MVVNLVTLLFFVLLNCISNIHTDDILGCGGFIQVDKDAALDLSKVEVRLYTKQGSLKYHTDCAPNNGYYFIPIYDKGEYVIKVTSPKGWSFEPAEMPITIDRINDACSLGKDINFIFKGFTINGKVLSNKRNTGPQGVSVHLYSDKSSEPLKITTTVNGGLYEFQNVLPGSYKIIASHPNWKLHLNEINVNVKSDSLTITDNLEVLGYDVKGSVISEGEPIQGVQFSLYSKLKDLTSSCGLSPVQQEIVKGDWKLICQAVSDLKGQFIFPIVSPGQYKLIPLYQGENIQFDIKPSEIEFSVEDSSLKIEEQFEVEGFRVSGRVVINGGSGVADARVFLNNQLVTTSNEDGHYNLENIKTGTYHLTAESDNIMFEKLTVRISPNTPFLPDIIAGSFKVCGEIKLKELPSSLANRARRVIFIPTGQMKDSAEPVITSTDSSGFFCQFLHSGSYKLEPMVLEAEVAVGLKFVPASYIVEVKQNPLSGFVFTQLRASVKGKINYIGPKSEIDIQLSSTSSQFSEQLTTSGQFEFRNILPGKYTMRVLKDIWCWKTKSIDVSVSDQNVNDLSFDQIGYFLTVVASHDTDAVYNLNGQTQGRLRLKAGTSKHCLEQPGNYLFTFESCHTFPTDSIEWNTDHPSVLTLNAIKHRTSFSVLSGHVIEDLRIAVTSGESEIKELAPNSIIEQSGQVRHTFSLDGQPGEMLELNPSADSLLFFPPKLIITVKNDCDEAAGEIVAQKGLFITGSIKPAIDDVMITITGGNLNEPLTVMTHSGGFYSVGPVNKDGYPIVDLEKTFKISAEKRGYLFQPASEFGDFLAEKLAEISVTITNNQNEPLPYVLVAVAGGVGFRQNTQTGHDGKVAFSELNPGDYFIKPVLKEYRFEPTSKLVHVDDGASVEVDIKGERVAFSCFGSVTTLNGEPESSVIIEAIGIGDGCSEYQEEAVTETNGQFRIRELLPQCQYIVRLKTGQGINKQLHRTLPASLEVKADNTDITGVRFVAIKSVNQADVAASVLVPNRDYLKSLRLKLYREDQPNIPIHSIKLDSSPLVLLPVLPMDGKRYTLQLDSSLARNIYEYRTPEVSFVNNVSVQHVILEFNPKPKTFDSETAQASISGILFILLIAAVAYNFNSLLPLFNHAVVRIASYLKTGESRSHSNVSSLGSPNNPIFTEQELALIESPAKKKAKARKAQ